jgi:preprotein translocase subunit SecG
MPASQEVLRFAVRAQRLHLESLIFFCFELLLNFLQSGTPFPVSPDSAVALDRWQLRMSNCCWKEPAIIGDSVSCAPDCIYSEQLRTPDSMIILVTILHVMVCLFLIIVVLLQSGKAGDISAAFGGQGSQAAFGPRGAATALSKATTLSAVLFMLTSVTLSVYAVKHGGPSSVLQGVKSAPAKTQPIAPATTPANPPAKK